MRVKRIFARVLHWHSGGAMLGGDAWVIDHGAAGVCPVCDPWCLYE